MKHLLLVLLCFSFFGIPSSFAQSFKMDWGPEYKKNGGTLDPLEVIGTTVDYFYALTGLGAGPTLLTFNKKKELVDSK